MENNQTIDQETWFDIAAAMELKNKDPSNWLLKFLTPSQDDWGEYLEVFSHPSIHPDDRCQPATKAYADEQYSQALRRACDNPGQLVIIYHEDRLDGRYLAH